MSPSNPTAQESESPAEGEAERVQGTQRREDTKKTRPRLTTGLMSMGTYRLQQHPQDLHKSAPDGVLEMRGEADIYSIPEATSH